MAMYEKEGYCPQNSVSTRLAADNADRRLAGLWSLVGPQTVYSKDPYDTADSDLDTMFCDDPIAYELLASMVKKNPVAKKIVVHQVRNGACNSQSIKDISRVMAENENPQLIVADKSRYAVVLADADYGLDIWAWNLWLC